MPNWVLFQEYPWGCLVVYLLLVGAGLPLPMAPVLIVAGSLAAGGTFWMPWLLVLAPVCLMPGDVLWYGLAWRHGHRVVDAVCLLALERDACVRKTQLTIKRFNLRAFLLGRFLPGFGIVAPPVAGASRQPLGPMLVYDGLGTLLYTTLFLGLGYVFADQLALLMPILNRAGRGMTALLVAALMVYVGYKVVARYWLAWRLGLSPLAVRRMLAARPEAQFIDLRSGNDLSQFPYLIVGATRRSEAELLEALEKVPVTTPMILFCYCPNQATSTDLVRRLRRRGYAAAYSLRGGIHAWKAAGLPLEPHGVGQVTARGVAIGGKDEV